MFSSYLEAENFNWIYEKPEGKLKCKAKTRYNMTEQPCTVWLEGDRVAALFDSPQRAVTSGQAVVLYDGDYVIGGGTII